MPDSLNLPEILDNPLHVWLIAVIGGVLVYLILRGVLKFVAARVRKREEFAPTLAGAVLLRLLRHTRRWLLFLLVMLVALAAPDLSPKLESLRQNAIVILVGLQLALWANSLIGLWLENVLKPGASRINPVMAAMLGWVGQVMVWTILLMFVLANMGVNITALVASLGVGGVAVALAAQTMISDLFASASIGLDKPFEVGQFIAFGNDLGTVDYVGIKTTRIRSLSGEQLIISNTNLLNQLIRNYGRMSERRVVFGFRVPYGTKRERVEAIPARVRTIIEQQQQVRFDRGHLASFGEYGLEFEFVYFVLNSDFSFYRDVQQRINLAIMALLEEFDVEFAVPVRHVRLAAEGMEGWPVTQAPSRPDQNRVN